jgi:hypothetical protein
MNMSKFSEKKTSIAPESADRIRADVLDPIDYQYREKRDIDITFPSPNIRRSVP